MKYKNAVLKLFLIIAVFLSIFIGLILLVQNQYFGEYYVRQKQEGFSRLNAELATRLDSRSIPEKDLMTELRKMESGFAVSAMLIREDEAASEDLLAGFKVFAVDHSMSTEVSAIVRRMAYSAFSDGSGYGQIQTIQENGLTYLAAISAVQINGDEYVLGVTASLQPVDEANAALSEVSWVAYTAAILAALGLSLIIALLVARPLVKEVERRKALDAMRKDFIANASHEMKTPISIISGYAERMNDMILSQEKYAEYSHIIYDETEKLGKLVKDMLEIALLQNEKYEPRKTEVELHSLLMQTLCRFDNQIQEKGIQIINNQTEPVSLLADKQMMETVFSNLVSNAVNYAPVNSSIRMNLKRIRTEIHFEIENEGDPIPEDALPHIWESFYRVDKSHNRETGRFGLGLHIVKSMIEKHGGIVGARNEEGKIMFFFVLFEMTPSHHCGKLG